jgi:hypothetical protein
MRAHELLETREAFLFHGTSVTSALEALREDRLRAYDHAISFTRDFSIARKFATIKSAGVIEYWTNERYDLFPSDNHLNDEHIAKVLPAAFLEHHWVGSWVGSSGGIIFVLDASKIRQRFRLTPHNDGRDNQDGKWEMEERLMKRDLVPFKMFVRKIIVSTNFPQIVDDLLSGNEKLGVSAQPQYREAVQFIRSKATE